MTDRRRVEDILRMQKPMLQAELTGIGLSSEQSIQVSDIVTNYLTIVLSKVMNAYKEVYSDESAKRLVKAAKSKGLL